MSELKDIYNFQQIDDQLATGGQPTIDQLQDLNLTGYNVIINLATGTTPRDLAQEGDIVVDMGLDYIHIPVDWDAPTSANLEDFYDAMKLKRDRQIFVHCIANKRVSAFVFLYRVNKRGADIDTARATLHRIWNPERDNPTWARFIADHL